MWMAENADYIKLQEGIYSLNKHAFGKCFTVVDKLLTPSIYFKSDQSVQKMLESIVCKIVTVKVV